jgi:hypothetical protein
MADSGTLRITRPYPSLDAYLEGDAWTVERSDMLLIGVEGVGPGTSVEFEIVLTSGETVVKGEGRAVETLAPRNGRPGGLKLRFRKLEGSSKATLKRALEVQKREKAKSSPVASEEPPKAEPANREAPKAEPAKVEAVAPKAAPPPAPAEPAEAAPEPPNGELRKTSAEPSGVRHRVAGPVAPPANRDALLARLRGRRGAAAE